MGIQGLGSIGRLAGLRGRVLHLRIHPEQRSKGWNRRWGRSKVGSGRNAPDIPRFRVWGSPRFAPSGVLHPLDPLPEIYPMGQIPPPEPLELSVSRPRVGVGWDLPLGAI